MGKIELKQLLIACLVFLIVTSLPIIAYTIQMKFTTQAPLGNWAEPWQNTCEEASIVMVDAFYNNKTLSSTDAQNQLQNILNIKEQYFGKSKDENAEQVVTLINNYLNWEAKLVNNPSVELIKNEIDNQRPVIIPTYGKALKNPNFLNGGSNYHMIVISGYDENSKTFITQEPGTSHGNNYPYSYSVLIEAIHDYLPNGQTKNGAPVAIFTNPQIKDSGSTDGDQDGLKKSLELIYKTSLISNDTDKDGYLDKEEVDSGYSPTVAELKLEFGSLIRSAKSGKVYLMENKTKRHVPNLETMNQNGWNWGQVITVSETFLNKFQNGLSIK
ncbi:hypothetical protein HN858_03115 [Candidatus Falkowbacteria bacterium]|jgi:hypothetical protein|nr:hypothetical protein [Candidatus Falkowbacteria bacterium]MBT5502946.1 hypothetical protein [Candidatus Falkowbacteria bacterium]MBT6574211.1 hypothetical protein [Candidatus Falkowbacteria bacterium]MBT7348641.1 hypothetical protein [Candidatus Falkowbacteria bacterium]MBT7500432.1 hypothetical protein [Candidatus Falkowbacteria bacterium]